MDTHFAVLKLKLVVLLLFPVCFVWGADCLNGQTIESLEQVVSAPKAPTAQPTLAGDGNLYGTSTEGGSSGFGTVYRILQDDTIEIVGSFTGTSGVLPGALASSAL